MNRTLNYSTPFFKSTKLVFILLLTISFLGNLNSQVKPQATVKPKTTTNSNAMYLITQFDVNQKSIPIGFKGHNSIELFNNLEKKSISLNKGEFETTAQFEERLTIAKSQSIIGNLNEYGTFALKPQKFELYPLDFAYNADTQEIELAIQLYKYTNSDNRFSFDDSRKAIKLYEKTIKDIKYNGTNAFGVAKEIHSRESIIYSLLISNWKSYVNGGVSYDLIKFKFKVKPDIAKQIKENDFRGNNAILSSIYIGKIVSPFTCKGYYYSGTPTLSDPYEYEDNINYINFNLSEIWIYNKNTGEILSKIKPYKDMVCDISYAVGDKKLISEIPTFDSYKFTDEGVITMNVEVFNIDGIVLVYDICSPTTINNKFLQADAMNICRELKFEKSNYFGRTTGTITLTFRRDSVIVDMQ